MAKKKITGEMQWIDNMLNRLGKKLNNVYLTYGETSEMYQRLAKSAVKNLKPFGLINVEKNGRIKIKRSTKARLTDTAKYAPFDLQYNIREADREFKSVNVRDERQKLINSIRGRREFNGDTNSQITISDIKNEAKLSLDLGSQISEILDYLYAEHSFIQDSLNVGKYKSTNAYVQYFDRLYGEAMDILNQRKKTVFELMRVVELVENSKQEKYNLSGYEVTENDGLSEYNNSIDNMVNNIAFRKAELDRLTKQYNKAQYRNPDKMGLKYFR